MGAVKDYMIGEECMAFNMLKATGIYTEDSFEFFMDECQELYEETDILNDDDYTKGALAYKLFMAIV